MTATVSAAAPERHHQYRAGLAAVAIAVMSWGITGVITKSIDAPSVAIAFWRFAAYAAVLTAVLAMRGRRLRLEAMRVTAPAGLLLAADVTLFFTAVKVTTISNASTIGALQPVLIGVAATRLFGERIHRREAIAAGCAIGGVVTVVAISSGTPQWSGWGDLAAVGALLAWSAYFVVAKRATARLPTLEFTAASAWWVAIATLPIGLIAGQDMAVPARAEWPLLIALIAAGGVFGHTFMNWGLPRLPLWLSSTMTLLNPVVASVAAWALLDEPLSATQLIAMLVVVAALAVIVTTDTNVPVPIPLDEPVAAERRLDADDGSGRRH